MDLDNAKKSLMDLKEILDRLNIRFWLSDGTLLGCIREQGFISHDPDIDVSIFINEWKTEAIEELKNNGFKVKWRFGLPECGMEIATEKRNVKIDLMFYYQDNFVTDKDGNSLFWHSLWEQDSRALGKFRRMVRCTYEPFELKKIDFLGDKFYVPSDPEKCLARKYGLWRIPVKTWDWSNDPLNATKVPIFIPYTDM